MRRGVQTRILHVLRRGGGEGRGGGGQDVGTGRCGRARCWDAGGAQRGVPPPPPHIPNASPGKSSASKADSRGGPKSAAGGTASTGTFPGPLWGGGAQCPARGSVSPPGTSPSCTCLPVPPRVPSPCCHLQGGGMRLGTWRERGRRDPQDRGTPGTASPGTCGPPGSAALGAADRAAVCPGEGHGDRGGLGDVGTGDVRGRGDAGTGGSRRHGGHHEVTLT